MWNEIKWNKNKKIIIVDENIFWSEQNEREVNQI